MTAETIVAAARACIGVRFRPWGRDPAHGLDCVGLAAHVFGLAAPRDYALRGGDVATVSGLIWAAGLVPVEAAGPGDLLLLAAGAGQLHLAIRTERGMVHADAGLRRIVETPGAPGQATGATMLGAWRREA